MKKDLQAALVIGAALWALSYGVGMTNHKATAEERAQVLAALQELGWPAPEVNAVINVESGWNPAARNPDGDASGLIQFMPATLASLGFAPDIAEPKQKAAKMRELDTLRQLPWVIKYFKMIGRQWQRAGDTYLAVAAPGFVGAPDETRIYPVGSAAWKANPGLREPGGGDITARSIRGVILRRLA